MKFTLPKSVVEASQKAKRSTRARTAKAKGRNFEAEVAEDIRNAFDAHEDDVKRTPASVSGNDIIVHHTLRARGWVYYTECKNQKSLSVPAWLRQAEEGRDRDSPDLVPIVVFKTHGNSKKRVIMDFDHFLDLVTGKANHNG